MAGCVAGVSEMQAVHCTVGISLPVTCLAGNTLYRAGSLGPLLGKLTTKQEQSWELGSSAQGHPQSHLTLSTCKSPAHIGYWDVTMSPALSQNTVQSREGVSSSGHWHLVGHGNECPLVWAGRCSWVWQGQCPEE